MLLSVSCIGHVSLQLPSLKMVDKAGTNPSPLTYQARGNVIQHRAVASNHLLCIGNHYFKEGEQFSLFVDPLKRSPKWGLHS